MSRAAQVDAELADPKAARDASSRQKLGRERVRLEPVDAPEADDASAPEGEAGRPEPEPEPGSQAGPTKSRISEEPDA